MRFIQRFFSRLPVLTGFTQYEIKAVLYFALLLLCGAAFMYFTRREKIPEQFSYTQTDSLYRALILQSNYDTVSSSVKKERVKKEAKSKRKGDIVPGEKIAINSAPFAALIRIPGIGKKTAEEILLLRKQGFRFKNINNLLEIKGIGGQKLEVMKPFISFD